MREIYAVDVYQTVKQRHAATNPQSHFKHFQWKTSLGMQWTVSMDWAYPKNNTQKKQTTEAIRFNWERKSRMIYQSVSRNPQEN